MKTHNKNGTMAITGNNKVVVTNKRKWIALLSISLCFLLCTSIGLRYAFINKVEPGFAGDSATSIIQQNQEKMKESNREYINNLAKDIQNHKLTRAEEIRIGTMFDILTDINENLNDDLYVTVQLQSMMDMLTEYEVAELANILGIDSEESKSHSISFRGNLRVVFTVDLTIGYIVGDIATRMFGAWTAGILGSATLAINPLLAVVVAAAGMAIGSAIGNLINGIIVSMGGDLWFYYKELCQFSIWLPFVQHTWYINLVDVIVTLLTMTGGNMHTGSSRPATVPRPTLILA